MRVSSFLLPLSLGALSLVWACSSTTVVTQPAAATDAGGSSSGEGDGGSSGADDTGAPKPTGPMTLTSSSFENGELFPTEYTCDGTETKSPPLAWTPGPEGTLSYAIVFNDNTPPGGSVPNGFKFAHSAIYDIPATVLELPEGVEAKYKPAAPAGAKQAPNYKGNPGFIGPCPPTGEHTYEFTLYALKVETLPGLTQTSTVAAVQAAAVKAQLEAVKLSGKYTQK